MNKQDKGVVGIEKTNYIMIDEFTSTDDKDTEKNVVEFIVNYINRKIDVEKQLHNLKNK